MKRRILSSLMALVLVFGLLPATAFAEGETVPDGKVKIGDTEYATLDEAMDAVEKGGTATIYLGKGTYSSYSSTVVQDKHLSLTFVGAGIGETTWNIGTGATDAKGQANGDFSFKGNNKLVFKDMTLKAGVTPSGDQVTRNYMGFAHTDITIVEDCVIDGLTCYWGYESAMFKNTTFNCPLWDYAIWTYSSPVMTFDNCTFNSSGKVINVYTDYGAGKHDITVNFMGCTVKNTSSNKAVLNINDSNMGNYKYILNISGNNTVSSSVSATGNGLLYKTRDSQTCSRLFGYSKEKNNTGRTIVKFNGIPVWENGKMVDAKKYHNEGVTVDGVTYDNGGSGANDILYAEGFKDNKFTTNEGTWTIDQDGNEIRTITKTCDYCGYQEKTIEYKPIEWEVPKSKTATQLDTSTWTSDVTLSLLNTKEDLEEGKDRIGAGSTVTDTIGKKFDFVGIKSLTVGGTELKSKADGNVTYFGDDANTLSKDSYRFKVDYDSAKTFVWTINEEVTQSAPVQLTYTVKLAAPETEPGTYGTKDLKGDDLTLTDAEALFTNESAVLNAKNSVGVPVEEQVFPKPSVSYTISSGTGGDDGDDDDDYFFAIQKVDAQDGHALNGATFELYQYDSKGKPVNRTTAKTSRNGSESGIALFSVDNKTSYDGIWYYAEVTAPEGYVLDSTEHKIKAKDFSDSRSTAVQNAVTVRNYRGTTPDLLNDSDHFAYVIGYKDGNVRPYGLISRAETTTIFFRLLKDSVRDGNLLTSNTYTDVADDYWANTAISTMTGLGIVQGRSATTFDPKAPITRAQFAAICARFDTGKTSGTQSFTDTKGHWAEKYIERAAELGWIRGFEDGTFRPDTYITRAQAMTMINRVLNRIPEENGDLLSSMNVWPDCNPGDWFYLAVQEATNSHDFEHKAGNYETWTGMNKDPDWTRYEH